MRLWRTWWAFSWSQCASPGSRSSAITTPLRATAVRLPARRRKSVNAPYSAGWASSGSSAAAWFFSGATRGVGGGGPVLPERQRGRGYQHHAFRLFTPLPHECDSDGPAYRLRQPEHPLHLIVDRVTHHYIDLNAHDARGYWPLPTCRPEAPAFRRPRGTGRTVRNRCGPARAGVRRRAGLLRPFPAGLAQPTAASTLPCKARKARYFTPSSDGPRVAGRGVRPGAWSGPVSASCCGLTPRTAACAASARTVCGSRESSSSPGQGPDVRSWPSMTSPHSGRTSGHQMPLRRASAVGVRWREWSAGCGYHRLGSRPCLLHPPLRAVTGRLANQNTPLSSSLPASVSHCARGATGGAASPFSAPGTGLSRGDLRPVAMVVTVGQHQGCSRFP